jgi:hypothetical protein
MASYFSYFPNVYVGEGITDDENFKYRLVKNIFRRVKARDDLEKYTTQFESYSIRDGETPSSLAYKFYEDSFLDWIFLIVNNITDVYEQWPKAESDLLSYINEKYDDPDAVHHYETNEVLYNGITLVKEGITVNSTFRVTMPDGTVLSESASIYPVSNYEYETFENEKKRLIVIPQPSMVDLIVGEMGDLLEYQPNVELDRANNKKTPLSLSSLFINNIGGNYVSTATSTVGQTVTSFDYGPTTASANTVGTATSSTAGVATTTTTSTTTTSTTTSSSSSSSSSGSSGNSGSSGGSGGY